MKRATVISISVFSAFFAVTLLYLALAQSLSPVTVEITSPVNGQVISNTVTLTATASSTAGPIQRVEFYRDGVLIGTVINFPHVPTNLRLAP